MTVNHITFKITEDLAETTSKNKPIPTLNTRLKVQTDIRCPVCGDYIYQHQKTLRYRCIRCGILFPIETVRKMVKKQLLREKWIRLQND